MVLLGSEGEARTVANSLEEFLKRWSKGETEVDELDDEEGASGRKELASWLKVKKVPAPKAKSFDFAAWLDGDVVPPPAAKAQATAAPKAAPTARIELVFAHDVLNEAYPPIPKTARTFIPYVSLAWVKAGIGETVLGAPWKPASEAELVKVLGPPTERRASFADEEELTVACWSYPGCSSAMPRPEACSTRRDFRRTASCSRQSSSARRRARSS